MEDRRAEGDVENWGPVQEVSENNIRDHSCDILATNVAAFCLCPKNLPEAKLKSFFLGYYHWQRRYQDTRIGCVSWLLVITQADL